MESLETFESRPARRKFSKPPVKVACLSCRSLRVRCDGQNPCSNCANKHASCSYVASRRGGPRNCQNRRRRKASVSLPAPASTPAPATIIDLPVNSDTTDTEERRSQPSSSFDTSIAQTSGEDQTSTAQTSGECSSSTGDADWFNQLFELSAPGAGLRSVDMPIAEMELIFDSIFDQDQGNASDLGVENNDSTVVDMVQLYGSHRDIMDAYYVFIHPYYPILPPPEQLPVSNRPLRGESAFQPSSPLSLAMAALLVLIPHPDEKNPSRPEYVKLRRDTAHAYAHSALEAVEVDSELLASFNDPSTALSDGVPQLDRDPLHPHVPVYLESVIALVLLSVYEYAQRGNINKMRNRAGQALTAAMSISLHETVEEDQYSEAKRRAWWMTYMAVCQGSIVSNTPAVFNVYDPRFVTPYPEAWKFLIEAQQTILEATTFVHDLDQTAKSSYNASWIPQRMQELETQITSLLLLCRSAAETPNSVVTLESPETIALRAMGSIAEIKLQSARIKTHRFCAFQDIPIFRKRHCDLGSTTRKAPECCNMNSIPSPGSSLESSNPSIQFPFSSHASSKICLHAALNIVSLLDNLPYPNPTNEIPYMAPPFMSPTSRVEIPRTMPTFACCAIQAGYAILMLCFKARTFNKQSPGGSGSVVDGNSFPSTTLTGFLNELQQNLRLIVRCLSNYSVAFEAIQGMRDEIAQAVDGGFNTQEVH